MPFDKNDPAMNVIIVKGSPSPGRARITGAAVPYKYHVQEGYGLSGATTTFVGRGLAKFTITIDLWTDLHFLAWPLFKKLLEPPKPGVPLVTDIGHPILSEQGIKAVAIESMGQFERVPSEGVWRRVMQCLEWRPPIPALVKPRGSIPSVTQGKPPLFDPFGSDPRVIAAVKAFETSRDAARR